MAVHLEAHWPVSPAPPATTREPVATRWIDRRGTCMCKGVTADHYVLRVFLTATTLRLEVNGRKLADGPVAAGTIHVSLPGDSLSMSVEGPGDSLQWYLPVSFVREVANHMGCIDIFEGGAQISPGRGVEGVEHLGTVERHIGDRAALLVEQVFEGRHRDGRIHRSVS